MPDIRLRTKETDSSLDVPLHVQPRAGRNQIVGIRNGALKLKITAPPVDDAANKAVIQFFATLLDIPKARLRIVSGERSREKILRIQGISAARLLSILPQNLP